LKARWQNLHKDAIISHPHALVEKQGIASEAKPSPVVPCAPIGRHVKRVFENLDLIKEEIPSIDTFPNLKYKFFHEEEAEYIVGFMDAGDAGL